MDSLKKVLTIGWDINLILGILNKVEEKSDIRFHNFVYEDVYHKVNTSDRKYYSKIPNQKVVELGEIDLDYIIQMEKDSPYMINNLIQFDRILKYVEYEEALLYISVVLKSLEKVIVEVKPLYILGSWDSVLPGLAKIVAIKYNIPFYVTKFSVIPDKLVTICDYPNPNREFEILVKSEQENIAFATQVLENWLDQRITAPAYKSVVSTLDIIKRIPFHINALLSRITKSLIYGRNRFIEYPLKRLIFQYIWKKSNIFFRDKNLYISEIPERPFFFYGFHMQPESSIDVWAPFYSNQFQVVESIARSMPIGYDLCIKIHISDADNYSNIQLKKYLEIPGVKIVSPNVSSRSFIENASMIFSIQGTIGLEGCLLGKQVVMFGDSPVTRFSTATKVQLLEDLPSIVKNKLSEQEPSKDDIIHGLAFYLKNYMPASSDDWVITMQQGLTDVEVDNYVKLFERLIVFRN